MSVEFKNQGFPGWFQDDPNKPTILRGNVSIIKDKDGANTPIVAEINYGDGSIQYYAVTTGIGFNGSRNTLFIQSASGERKVQNQAYLDRLNPEDIKKIESSVKSVAFRANQQLASSSEKEKLKNSQYYRSKANKEQPKGGEGSGNSEPNNPQKEEKLLSLDQIKKEFIKDGSYRKNYDQKLTYPEKFPIDQDKMSFTMIRYIPKEFNTENVGDKKDAEIFSPRVISVTKILGSVILPIQPQITDSMNVSWGSDSMSSIQANAAAGALSLMVGDYDAAGNLIKSVGNNAQELKAAAVAGLASKAAQSDAKLLTRLTGGIVNPNMELLFDAPGLREFTFTFVFSPRSNSEANRVKKILRFFKQGMTPKRSSSSLFLMSPNIFDIKYIFGKGGENEDHPWINKIKTCALKSCNVNYTPAGNYATYEDGSMTSYEMSLIFGELEPIYDDDYTNVDSNADLRIGY